ncbi:30S ribosomal protein S20 [Candidatus Microgenomates bacterium]|nr:30S ribosomal protein S20 [Candidatus Microgenomates bacterium]
MPITRGARKKLRQDKKRQKQNLLVKKEVKKLINKYRKSPTKALLSQIYSLLDETAKKKIFHRNKVARLKSRLTKLLGKKTLKATPKKTSRKKKTVV